MIETFIVLAPLIAAAIAGLGQRFLGDKLAMALTTGVLGLCCALSLYTFAAFTWGDAPERVTELFRFIDVAGFTSTWSVRIDSLSVVMLVVVTVVSFLVHVYSIGYMAEDPHRARFFSYLSFFTFAMLALVTANDFLQMFFGWEGVGVASYLLIGFWYQNKAPNDAAIKAFVVNRVGDFGFALGIMACFFAYGSIRFDEVFAQAAAHPQLMIGVGDISFRAVEVVSGLLFIGAMGKSAQFFLHTWLPDAMEGPTPVSALIHAATMVTAGVFMVCRCASLYELAPYAAGFVTIIGATTAIFAATVGLAQNDIKRVVAYSTCSQLGSMFFAAGVGAYNVAMFHLFTHAFFKALLFLGAGSVIHGLHHEQDMRRMGGVRGPMTITWAMMLIGTLALIGFGVPGFFGLAGFYSKDAAFEAAFAGIEAGRIGAQWAFWAGVGAALLTSFYSWRLLFMTFEGTYRGAAHGHGEHHGHGETHGAHHQQSGAAPAHESPMVMLAPLFVLAFGAQLFIQGTFRARQEKRPEPAFTTPPAPASPSVPALDGSRPWHAARAAVTNDGAFLVFWKPTPDPIEERKTFALEAWVTRRETPNELAPGTELLLDAAMPEHGHGMNVVPRTTREGDGRFRIEGTRLHMPGRWELYFDVRAGRRTERAQVTLVLD